MLIKLGFHGLKTNCIIGVLEQERQQEQLVESDLMITVNVSATIDDDVQQTVDYRQLATLFADHARRGKYYLLESLAVGFQTLLMDTHPNIQAAMLEIRKPTAIPSADSAFVRLEW